MTKFKREMENGDGWSDWIMPNQPIYKMMCCDCGLVHNIEFDIMFDEMNKKDRPIFRVQRNNRSTSQARRHKKNKQLTLLSRDVNVQPLVIHPGCVCQECGKHYTVDLNIPDDLWEKIKPDGKQKGSGLLCGKCIMSKIEEIKEFAAYKLTAV